MDQPMQLNRDTIDTIVRDLRRALQDDLREAGVLAPDNYEMAPRWAGGEVILKPGKSGAQEKAIPLDTFFRKIVMVRERLRVLEQRINNHPKLDDADRIELQDYITRIYGSLTTFNILFDDRTDWFVGQSGDR